MFTVRSLGRDRPDRLWRWLGTRVEVLSVQKWFSRRSGSWVSLMVRWIAIKKANVSGPYCWRGEVRNGPQFEPDAFDSCIWSIDQKTYRTTLILLSGARRLMLP